MTAARRAGRWAGPLGRVRFGSLRALWVRAASRAGGVAPRSDGLFVTQRLSVAPQLSMVQEVGDALDLSVVADPRAHRRPRPWRAYVGSQRHVNERPRPARRSVFWGRRARGRRELGDVARA